MVKLVMCAPGKTGKILRTALALAICKNCTNGTNQNFLEAERVCFVFDWVTSERTRNLQSGKLISLKLLYLDLIHHFVKLIEF